MNTQPLVPISALAMSDVGPNMGKFIAEAGLEV